MVSKENIKCNPIPPGIDDLIAMELLEEVRHILKRLFKQHTGDLVESSVEGVQVSNEQIKRNSIPSGIEDLSAELLVEEAGRIFEGPLKKQTDDLVESPVEGAVKNKRCVAAVEEVEHHVEAPVRKTDASAKPPMEVEYDVKGSSKKTRVTSEDDSYVRGS